MLAGGFPSKGRGVMADGKDREQLIRERAYQIWEREGARE